MRTHKWPHILAHASLTAGTLNRMSAFRQPGEKRRNQETELARKSGDVRDGAQPNGGERESGAEHALRARWQEQARKDLGTRGSSPLPPPRSPLCCPSTSESPASLFPPTGAPARAAPFPPLHPIHAGRVTTRTATNESAGK